MAGVKQGKEIKNVIRGDTRRVRCLFLDEDGDPINLTGGTVYFTVNSSSDPANDGTATLQKVATSLTDPTNGIHTFTLTHNDTNIDAGDYWYDAQFVDSNGEYLSSYRGKFGVQSDTTRT